MSINRSLFERLRDPGPRDERQLHVTSRDIFDSIISNLQRLFNTIRGNCVTDELYGLPHLSGIRSSMPGTLAPYETALRETIERHEPRLSNVRVRFAPYEELGGVISLRFEITGTIEEDDGKRSVRFETFADDAGRLRVR